jgi:hypothetical protein
MVAPAAPSDRHQDQKSQPTTSPSAHPPSPAPSFSSQVIEFTNLPPQFADDLPLGRPDSLTIPSLRSTGSSGLPSLRRTTNDDSCSSVSSVSAVSLTEEDILPPMPTPQTVPPRGRPSAAHLNGAWQSFFCNALQPNPPGSRYRCPPFDARGSSPPPLQPARMRLLATISTNAPPISSGSGP